MRSKPATGGFEEHRLQLSVQHVIDSLVQHADGAELAFETVCTSARIVKLSATATVRSQAVAQLSTRGQEVWRPDMYHGMDLYASSDPDTGAFHTKTGSDTAPAAWPPGIGATVAYVLIRHPDVTERDIRNAIGR